MRAAEARGMAAGVSEDALMENAGLAAARAARRMAAPLAGVPILALIGPGNNGGDGLVTALHLRRWGARVVAYAVRGRPSPDPKMAAALDAGVVALSAEDDDGLRRLRDLLASAHLVIDAVLGTGRSRPMAGVTRDVFLALAAARAGGRAPKLLAMDVPSGMDCDSGAADAACVAADATVAFGLPKLGHFEFPGANLAGRLEVADIGLPRGADADIPTRLIAEDWARSSLPSRAADSHKGSYGRAMIVAGSRSFRGAPHLAAAAAIRVGAGLATIAMPESLIPSVAPRGVEPTFLPLPESEPGVASADAGERVIESLNGYDALLIGCGLSQHPNMRAMVERILLSGERLPPTVVDADGLNALALVPDWSERWRADAALTPHPGEMARLAARGDESRLEWARAAAARWGKSVALKGAHTVVARADGGAMVSPFANPALATAGTGDALAGAIAGLLSQGLPIETATPLGVYLHGAAGERASRETGDAGMIASDLLPALPRTIAALKRGGSAWRS